MSKIELINKAIQDILDTLPNHSNKAYLLEDYEYGMKTIHTMFDSYYDEHKTLYIDKNGVYINGRGQSQGDKTKMYLKDFKGILLSEETEKSIQSEIDKITNKLDSRIPSKDIKVGMFCKEFDKKNYYYIYIGKCELTMDYSKARHDCDRKKGIQKRKYNIYYSGYGGTYKYETTENFKSEEMELTYSCEFDISKSKTKIRFDKIVETVDINKVNMIRKSIKKVLNYNEKEYLSEIKWLD